MLVHDTMYEDVWTIFSEFIVALQTLGEEVTKVNNIQIQTNKKPAEETINIMNLQWYLYMLYLVNIGVAERIKTFTPTTATHTATQPTSQEVSYSSLQTVSLSTKPENICDPPNFIRNCTRHQIFVAQLRLIILGHSDLSLLITHLLMYSTWQMQSTVLERIMLHITSITVNLASL